MRLLLVLLSLIVVFPALAGDHPAEDRNCPSRDFADFLGVYSEDVEVQKHFTTFPLSTQELDREGELEPIERALTADLVIFPVIPPENERRQQALMLSVDEISEQYARVRLFKEDTDYLVFYVFSKAECWRLERIEDRSL
jgi:hypothetical protein